MRRRASSDGRCMAPSWRREAETLGRGRHLVEHLGRGGSRRAHPPCRSNSRIGDQPVHAEVLVGAHGRRRRCGTGGGVMVISSGPRSSGRSISSCRRASSSSASRVRSTSRKNPYQPWHRATARRRAAVDMPLAWIGSGRCTGCGRHWMPENDTNSPLQRRVVVVPQRAQGVDALVGTPAAGVEVVRRSPRTRRARTPRRCRRRAGRPTARRSTPSPWRRSPGCAAAGSRCRCRCGWSTSRAAANASAGTGSSSSLCGGKRRRAARAGRRAPGARRSRSTRSRATRRAATSATPAASASTPEPAPNQPSFIACGSRGHEVAYRWRRACAAPTWVMMSTTKAKITTNHPKPVTPSRRRVGDRPRQRRPREEDPAEEAPPERVERDAHAVGEQPEQEHRQTRRQHRHDRHQTSAHGRRTLTAFPVLASEARDIHALTDAETG